jgi:hypothetical protein
MMGLLVIPLMFGLVGATIVSSRGKWQKGTVGNLLARAE